MTIFSWPGASNLVRQNNLVRLKVKMANYFNKTFRRCSILLLLQLKISQGRVMIINEKWILDK